MIMAISKQLILYIHFSYKIGYTTYGFTINIVNVKDC